MWPVGITPETWPTLVKRLVGAFGVITHGRVDAEGRASAIEPRLGPRHPTVSSDSQRVALTMTDPRLPPVPSGTGVTLVISADRLVGEIRSNAEFVSGLGPRIVRAGELRVMEARGG
jgi:hypothetical protein